MLLFLVDSINAIQSTRPEILTFPGYSSTPLMIGAKVRSQPDCISFGAHSSPETNVGWLVHLSTDTASVSYPGRRVPARFLAHRPCAGMIER